MTDSTPGYYTIYVAENEGSFERKGNFSFPSKNSTHEINRLKPCTEYQLNVTFIDSNDTEIPCNKTENVTTTTTTTGMTEQDIKSISCSPGYFCYQSGWNISSLLSGNNVSDVQFINGSYRFKHAYDDMCSDLVLEFPQENCSNTMFTISKNFTLDFIDPNDIKQTGSAKLPAEINTTLPSSCKDLSVEYKCSGMNNDSVKLSDMKPFTNYSCTGDIKMNNVSINKTTKPVQFNIDCDFKVNNLMNSSTSTSIELNWETKSEKCQDVLNELDELDYHCSCKQDERGDGNYEEIGKKEIKQHEGRKCVFTRKIKPFRNYNCEVGHIYAGQSPFVKATVKGRTKSGTPEPPHITEVKVPESSNNKIEVKCSLNRIDFNGPKRIFSAELQGVAGSRKNNTICLFEFENLSYLTSYTVEVFTFNGDFTSSPVRRQVDTRHNSKALIGFLVFLIIFIILCVAFFIMKRRKPRNAVNEEQKRFSTVIYANMPPPKRNHNY